MKDFELTDEEIFIPAGFQFGSIAAGIKASGKRDLTLILADQEVTSLGAFTQNVIRAPSVDWNETHVGSCRAVLINSGNANACTGLQGEQDNRQLAEWVAGSVECPVERVHIMSTGIIGEHLPMDVFGPGSPSHHGSVGSVGRIGPGGGRRDDDDGFICQDRIRQI